METRTELILLQRTMVVVEGVARSLNPHINIWQVAQPTVERYIQDNVGPRALVRDLAKTARVLTRFGPKLPTLMEDLLTQDHQQLPEAQKPGKFQIAGWMALGAVAAAAIAAIVEMI
jgi:ubiquinone biosynthesis protein